MELTAEPELSFLIFTAEPGSDSKAWLDLLANWTATDCQHEKESLQTGAQLDPRKSRRSRQRSVLAPSRP